MVRNQLFKTNLRAFAVGITAFVILTGVLWLLVAVELYACRPLGWLTLAVFGLYLPPLLLRHERRPSITITPDLQIIERKGRKLDTRLVGAAWGSLISTFILGSIVWVLLADRVR